VTFVQVFFQELTDNCLLLFIAFYVSLHAGVLFLHFTISFYNFDIQHLTQARFMNSYFGCTALDIRSCHIFYLLKFSVTIESLQKNPVTTAYFQALSSSLSLSSLLTFSFIVCTPFYLLTVGADGYCCTWPHLMSHKRLDSSV
jgi:hypothetical protein